MGYSEEIIVMVPRIGFMFSSDMPVEKHRLNQQQQDIPAHLVESRPQKKHRSVVLTVSAGLLLFALLLVVKGSVFINQTSSEIVSQKTWPVGNINSCKVFSFTPASTETTQLKLTMVNDILQTQKLPCAPDGDIYFQLLSPRFMVPLAGSFIYLPQQRSRHNGVLLLLQFLRDRL